MCGDGRARAITLPSGSSSPRPSQRLEPGDGPRAMSVKAESLEGLAVVTLKRRAGFRAWSALADHALVLAITIHGVTNRHGTSEDGGYKIKKLCTDFLRK